MKPFNRWYSLNRLTGINPLEEGKIPNPNIHLSVPTFVDFAHRIDAFDNRAVYLTCFDDDDIDVLGDLLIDFQTIKPFTLHFDTTSQCYTLQAYKNPDLDLSEFWVKHKFSNRDFAIQVLNTCNKQAIKAIQQKLGTSHDN